MFRRGRCVSIGLVIATIFKTTEVFLLNPGKKNGKTGNWQSQECWNVLNKRQVRHSCLCPLFPFFFLLPFFLFLLPYTDNTGVTTPVCEQRVVGLISKGLPSVSAFRPWRNQPSVLVPLSLSHLDAESPWLTPIPSWMPSRRSSSAASPRGLCSAVKESWLPMSPQVHPTRWEGGGGGGGGGEVERRRKQDVMGSNWSC